MSFHWWSEGGGVKIANIIAIAIEDCGTDKLLTFGEP